MEELRLGYLLSLNVEELKAKEMELENIKHKRYILIITIVCILFLFAMIMFVSFIYINNKMLKQKSKENALKQRISEKTEENYIIDQAQYTVDKQSYQKNFEGVFDHHYQKIDKYIENLKKQGILCDDDRVHIGFFAENIYPPLYEEWRNGEPRFVGELLYFLTRQFYDFVQSKERLEFMLFGCIYNQNPQLFYIKPSDKGKNLIDLEDNSVVFSKMNGNEFTFAYSL